MSSRYTDSNTRIFSSYEHNRDLAPEYYISLQLKDELVQQRQRLEQLFYDLKPRTLEKEK